MQKMIYLICLVAISTVLCSFSFARSLVNTQVIDVESIERLSVSYTADEVCFYESPTNELILKEYMNRNNSDYFAVINASDNSVQIKNGDRQWATWLSCKAEVYLPKAFNGNLDISTVSGRIIVNMDIVARSCNITSASGSVKVRNVSAPNVAIRTTSGRIETDQIEGNVYLKSTSGRIEVESLKGEKLDVGTTSGSIQIDNFRSETLNAKSNSGSIVLGRGYGKVIASTSSGRIAIEQAYGSANLKSTSGRISANYGYVDGDMFIKSTSGKVSLYIPDDLSYYFDAHSTSGTIYLNSKSESLKSQKAIVRKIGASPTFSVEIKTTSGGIEVVSQPAVNKQDILDLPRIL
ncbi:DUF4097 family beta strand repeat-containing protein [Paludibacter sp. 221]|uniref:DUF4097 family beta strand repeat-containing protein n=1 Tax=Paludibacter sp. 221 TaxID=2302939 RepID=UPI0013D7B093|nr:DUF4097 family beta strand repeat-containing protein [Paludibacter sp. 221]